VADTDHEVGAVRAQAFAQLGRECSADQLRYVAREVTFDNAAYVVFAKDLCIHGHL
jgi:hypothetical protein